MLTVLAVPFLETHLIPIVQQGATFQVRSQHRQGECWCVFFWRFPGLFFGLFP